MSIFFLSFKILVSPLIIDSESDADIKSVEISVWYTVVSSPSPNLVKDLLSLLFAIIYNCFTDNNPFSWEVSSYSYKLLNSLSIAFL